LIAQPLPGAVAWWKYLSFPGWRMLIFAQGDSSLNVDVFLYGLHNTAASLLQLVKEIQSTQVLA
jgi:hypothetical protein